jgi:MoxR-like ATPase
VNISFPDQLTLIEIMRRTTGSDEPQEHLRQVIDSAAKLASWHPLIRQVQTEKAILDYGARLILATHPNGDESGPARQYVRFGASPRGLQSMILAAKMRALLDGRTTVRRDDMRAVVPECLQHRLILNFEAQSRGVTVSDVIDEVLRQVRY